MTDQVVRDPAKPPRTAPGPDQADVIVRNAKVTTLQDDRPEAQAFAVRSEKIVAVGDDPEIVRLRGDRTRVIDAEGRRVIPGLNDSHLHAIRGALFYNLELRWDGVRSLQRGLQMIREQAKRTPKGGWVRVIGGWSPFQFDEQRWPTGVELNDAAPDTPVFVLFAYSQVMLNKAGAAALKLTPDSKPVEGGTYECVDGGGLVVQGTAAVYATIAQLPTLPDAGDQLNSTRYFFKELNRFGMTSTVDAGATGVDYPRDYKAVGTMAAWPKFPIRIASFLFAQKRGTEIESFKQWTAMNERGVNHADSRLNGFVLEGGGEILVWDASDFENFMAPRLELKPQVDDELREVTELLSRNHWPIRIHATYDETITGATTRGSDELPTRLDALRIYTP